MLLLVPTAVLLACGHEVVPFRDYSTRILCRARDGTLDDARARLDRDEDGQLSPADLSAGEAVAIIEMTGTHTDSGVEAGPSLSMNIDWHSRLDASNEGADTVEFSMTTPCLPVATLTVSFGLREAGDQVIESFGFRSDEANASTRPSDVQVEGVVETSIDSGRVSGVLRGGGHGALFSELPPEVGLSEITGFEVELFELAFRELEVP